MAFDLEAIKKTFFRPELITDPAEKAIVRVLSKAGAFLRRKQQSLIRYRKKPSAPGQPPSAHRSERFTRAKTNKKTGQVTRQAASPLHDLIFFGLDDSKKSVVSGPVPFLKSRQAGIPETLEKGGTVVKLVPVKQPQGRPAGLIQAAAYKLMILEGRIVPAPTQYFKRAVQIAARPSAVPALKSEAPKFADAFKNAIRNGS